jgi:ABC-2 type transport system ATP-binding protein
MSCMSSPLTISNLHCTLHKNHILQWVSFSLNAWEIYGFLWPNGAGKTTTLLAMLGQHIYQAGSVLFRWQSLDNTIRHRIGYAPDTCLYNDALTGRENIALVGSYLWLAPDVVSGQTESLLERLGLWFAADRCVSTYSHGMKQRLGVIISLITDPDLIIRDEPMNGLDPLGRQCIKDLMVDLRTQGKTILFSTHILWDIEQIADRYGIMQAWTMIHHSETHAIPMWYDSLESFFCHIVQTTDIH